MSISLSELLVLGQGSDLASERGVSCTGELPPASDPHLVERAIAARAALGSRALILGHHYQRDEVIQFADITGDSFKLAQSAAAQRENMAEPSAHHRMRRKHLSGHLLRPRRFSSFLTNT